MNFYALFWVYLLSVMAPIVFWLLFFRRLDKQEPEPKRRVFQAFQFGFMAVTLAMAAEFFFEKALGQEVLKNQYLAASAVFPFQVPMLIFLSFFLAGPIEEIAKYLLLKAAIWKSPDFNQIADGAVYGTALALGFALVENTSYFLDIQDFLNPEDFLLIAFLRGFFTTLLHLVCTGIVGLFLARAKFLSKPILAIEGAMIASLIHGAYNLAIFFPGGLGFNFSLVALGLGYLVFKMKSHEAQLVWEEQKSDSNCKS